MIFVQKIGDIFPNMVALLGIDKKFKSRLLMFYWDKIVGGDIASQAEPVKVEYGVLIVAVQNSVWHHHLLMMKADILYKLNQFIGEPLIRDIKFKNQSIVKKEFEEAESKEENLNSLLKNVELGKKEMEEIDCQCGRIEDEALRSRISKIYEKHLRLKKAKLCRNWHTCAGCGALCPIEEAYCSVCCRDKKTAKISEIRRALQDVPWATYAEINRYIPCTAREYIDAKVTLLCRIASSISLEDEESIEAKALTMLFTGAKHNEIDRRLIQRTLAKFRRKNYVSTSRS